MSNLKESFKLSDKNLFVYSANGKSPFEGFDTIKTSVQHYTTEDEYNKYLGEFYLENAETFANGSFLGVQREGNTVYFLVLREPVHVLTKTDWPLLKEQKADLVELSRKLVELSRKLGKKDKKKARSYERSLDGVINLIDVLQDYAVDVLGVPEEDVFYTEDI